MHLRLSEDEHGQEMPYIKESNAHDFDLQSEIDRKVSLFFVCASLFLLGATVALVTAAFMVVRSWI